MNLLIVNIPNLLADQLAYLASSRMGAAEVALEASTLVNQISRRADVGVWSIKLLCKLRKYA